MLPPLQQHDDYVDCARDVALREMGLVCIFSIFSDVYYSVLVSSLETVDLHF